MKTLADFQPLKPAEEKLLECCQNGELALIGEERPTDKTEENEIRAEFLRWLILTKDIKIDPAGIRFKGAWINHILNLSNIQCEYSLNFQNCVFEKKFFLGHASTKSIYVDGSLFKEGIFADGLKCQGSVHLRNDFESRAEVRFLGAKIEGNLSCKRATFKAVNDEQAALSCDRINIFGSVFLNSCSAEGKVRFLGANIRNNFDCDSAVYQASKETQKALNCNGINVGGRISLRKECLITCGGIDFTSSIVGSLTDDNNFWQQARLKKIQLDGFRYSHIYGSTSASFRLQNMLAKMPKFKPQPYRELAKVLRNMGHDRDADEVMIALRDKQLEESKESRAYKLLRKLYKWTSEYGYRPMRILKIMATIWLFLGCIYWYGANVAVFAPSNPLIFQNDYNCTIDKNGTPWLALPKDYNASNNWYEASPPEYTTFQPFWYSLDIILPVVDLKMEKDWGVVIPSPDGSFFKTFNYFVRFLTWSENIIGWILSLLLVAILSGLAKNEKE